MLKIHAFFISLIITLTPNIANAQYDDSPSGAAAWNTCWGMQQGMPFLVAFQMGINPLTAMLDQRRAQPMKMTRNFMTIANFMEKINRLPEAEKKSRMDAFTKNTLKKVLRSCPNNLGASEAQEVREYIGK